MKQSVCLKGVEAALHVLVLVLLFRENNEEMDICMVVLVSSENDGSEK